MKAGLIIYYTCFGCGYGYYMDYVYDGGNNYFCPHCGQKKKVIGRYLAEHVPFEKENFDAWEVATPALYDLIQYLAEHYPDGMGEDVFHEVEEALLHRDGLESIFTYEDEVLKQHIEHVFNDVLGEER